MFGDDDEAKVDRVMSEYSYRRESDDMWDNLILYLFYAAVAVVGMAHEGPVRRLAQGRGADQGDERRVLDPALRDSRRASSGAQLHPLRGDQAAARVVADGSAHRVRSRGVLYGIYEELRHVFLRIDVDAVTSLGRCGDG